MRMETIIESEGVDMSPPPPREVDGNELFNKALYLFGFIPADDDPRWALINGYVLAQKPRFKRVTFEAALSGIYLSQTPSYRNGYGCWGSEPNLRQLSRAIINMRTYPFLKVLYERVKDSIDIPDGFKLELARTNRILKGTDRRAITGCPEAAHQLRLFDGSEYRGRIGFNAHREQGGIILSITNVQGVPGGEDYYKEMKEKYNVNPFNFLIGVLKLMTGESPYPMPLRGLKNPKYGESRALYHGVFKLEGIPRANFTRHQ